MKKIGYLAANISRAQAVLAELVSKHQLIDIEKDPNQAIDILLVLGGDGFMLHAIHRYMHQNIPIYGLNCGTVGFLLNPYEQGGNIINIIESSFPIELKILKISATDFHDNIYTTYAVNEASIFRLSYQASFLKVAVNHRTHIEKLVGDGIIVSTAAGSSAYNFSAGGPILPINSGLIAVTGINTFRPRRWQSAILADSVNITLEVLDPSTRPIMLTADYNEFLHIKKVELFIDHQKIIKLLFNSQQQLFNRVINEQFICN